MSVNRKKGMSREEMAAVMTPPRSTLGADQKPVTAEAAYNTFAKKAYAEAVAAEAKRRGEGRDTK